MLRDRARKGLGEAVCNPERHLNKHIGGKMKALFQGTYYDVPEWANYIAKNADGLIYAYESQPKQLEVNRRPEGGRCECVGTANCAKIVREE